MWHALDEVTIRRELQWAADLHYNAVRVFLHDQLYTQLGEKAFLQRIHRFLDMAASYHLRCILVLLEGRWDPIAHYDPANASTYTPIPRPRVHNSRWVQSPGRRVLEAADEALQEAQLKPYVQAVVRTFGNDPDRVLLLDLWDQPEHDNRYSYGSLGERVPATQDARGQELDPLSKAQLVEQLVPRVVQWAREVGELSVPITIAAWSIPDDDHWLMQNAELYLARDRLRSMYLSVSDVISFHNYDNATRIAEIVTELRTSFPIRPIICSSYMSRESASTLDPVLARLYHENVWAFNWGLVAGKTQTMYNDTSWNELPLEHAEPELWHQDVLHSDGTPYWESERDFLLSYRPHEMENQDMSGSKISGDGRASSSAFVVLDGLLVGTAVLLLAAVAILWERRQRQNFVMVADAEQTTFVADMELAPVD